MSSLQSDALSGHDRIARKFLKKRHKELLDGLNLEEIKIQLYTDEVLDPTVQDKLMNASLGERAKLEELLLYLTRQGEPGLLALIDALKKCVEDPSQAKLGLDLEQQYQMFLSASHSVGSTGSSSLVSREVTGSTGSRITSDVDESDSIYPRPPIHMGVVNWRPQSPIYIKIVVIGPVGCGKTSLMLRYTRGQFDILKSPSVVVEFSSKHFLRDGLQYFLEFHDTPGHNKYDSIVSQYWRNTHGALVVYDIIDQMSLKHALEWKKHLDKNVVQRDGNHIPAVLIGNKCDKVEQSKQLFEAPPAVWQKHKFLGFFATSVKTEQNVVNSVEFLVKKILEAGIPITHYLPDHRGPKIEQVANPTGEVTPSTSKCC